MILKRQKLQALIQSKEQSLQQPDLPDKDEVKKRLQQYQQEKAMLSAKISRLNKKISLASSPVGVGRWTQFSTMEQLRLVCDVLLNQIITRTEKNNSLSKENQKLENDREDLLLQCILIDVKVNVIIYSEGRRQQNSLLVESNLSRSVPSRY